MKLNLTIKNMLIGLVLTGAAVAAALAWAGFYSNEKLIESQARLTDIVLPLETANHGIRGAASAFIERQGQIMASDSPEELDKLAERENFEQQFKHSLKELESLSGEKAGAGEKINQLKKIYEDFLIKDSAILESVRISLKVKRSIENQIDILDKSGAELQKNAEAVSGRINFAAMREKIALREYVNTQEKSDELHTAVKELLQGDLTRIQKACNDLRLGVASLATYGRHILLVKDQDSINSIQGNKIAQASTLVETSLDVLKKELADSNELLVIIDKIESDFKLLNTTLAELGKLRGLWLVEKEKTNKLRVSLKDSTLAITGHLDSLQKIAGTIRKSAETGAARVIEWTRMFVFSAALISIAVMIIIGYVTFRKIIDPINKAVSFADTISKGDLTAKIQLDKSELTARFGLGRNDEIGNLVSRLSDMAHNLNTLIGKVQQSGIQVNSSATELAATARQQEAILSNQARSTDYVLKSMGEISNVSTELVTTMQQVAAMSGETAEFASSGQADLARMKDAIHNMEDASKSISGKLETINEKAANITSVVTTITKVADQTNLLSLNAAIEAEKAGEYGRGFTVVAREIRRLADQTAVATLDIEQMVQEMQTAVSAGVMEMDAFIKEVQRSAEDVSRISTQLARIIEQVQALSPSFENVNESMQFQSEKSTKINKAMTSLGLEMQQTVESLKESFLAIEQLNEAARELQNEVSRFKIAKDV